MIKKSRISQIKEKSKLLEKEIRSQAIGYILTAFGLVAGLAWNEAIKSIITEFFPSTENTIMAQLSYALIITVIAVIFGIYLTKLITKKE